MMNQDFTVKKKSNICLKKKFVQRGSPEKKFLHKQWAKKKIRPSWKFPTPPITFLMVRPLKGKIANEIGQLVGERGGGNGNKFMSNFYVHTGPFIHCLFFIYSPKNYATVEIHPFTF